MRKSIFPSIGIDTYPSTTAGNGKRIGVTPFRRCQQCGLPNDTRKTAWASQGDGLSEIGGSSPAEWEAAGGCRFCGSLQWIYNKPSKLPDDKKLPTPGIGRKNRRK